jgi:hypothetical protein
MPLTGTRYAAGEAVDESAVAVKVKVVPVMF